MSQPEMEIEPPAPRGAKSNASTASAVAISAVSRAANRRKEVIGYPSTRVRVPYSEVYPSEPMPIDLRQLYVSVRKRLGLVSAIVAVAMCAAAYLITNMDEVYLSQVQVELKPERTNVVDLSSGSHEGEVLAFVETQIEILRSRDLAYRVAERLDLAYVPEFNARLRRAQKQLETAFAAHAAPRLDETGLVIGTEDVDRAANQLKGQVTAERQGKSYLVEVSAASENPRRAAQIADAVVDTYLAVDLRSRVDGYRNTARWLEQEVDQVRARLSKAETAVEMFKRKHRLAETSDGTVSDQQLVDLNAQLATARADVAERQAHHNKMTVLIEAGESVETLSKAMSSEVLQSLREARTELVQRLAEQSTQLGHQHPTFIATKSEMRDVEREIKAEIDRIVISLKNDVDVAQERVAALEKSVEDVETRELQSESIMMELNRLQVEAEGERKLLENLLAGSRESVVLAGQQSIEPIARKIASATVPSLPDGPNKKVILVLAFAGSSAFALGLAVVLGMLDERVSTGRELEEKLGLPNLATIPLQPQLDHMRGPRAMAQRRRLLARHRSIFAEAFRRARANLVLLDVENPPSVIMVASALPGDGKSTTAFCLAQSSASSGIRTLLVDADFRNPSLSSALVKNVSVGFAELLTGECSVEEAIVVEPNSGLEILPLREAVYAQPGWLNGQSLQRFFEVVGQQYGLVVVDSAPILPVGDAPIISRWVDATVFAVKWEGTPLSALQSAVEKVHQAGCELCAVVLTQSDIRRVRTYGYGDDVYYASRYSSERQRAATKKAHRHPGQVLKSLFRKNKKKGLASSHQVQVKQGPITNESSV